MTTTTELQAQLLAQASNVIDAVSKAASAAAAELPEIATQYVMYGQAMSSIYVGVGLVMLLVGLYVFIGMGLLNCKNFPAKSYGGWSDARAGSTMAGAFVSFIGIMALVTNLPTFVLVWFAPKIWLIKEIGSLLK